LLCVPNSYGKQKSLSESGEGAGIVKEPVVRLFS
jgi:hypothetical protein